MPFDLTPAQRALQAKARELARGPIADRAAEIDRSEAYPWDNVALLKDAGFFGMTIPTAYGGLGASYLDAVLVIEEMAKCCGVSGRIVVEANMGAIGAIMAYGSEAQKRRAAELVLSGDKPAICITEPAAGSAASEMTTRAERRGNGFLITGKKHWITGGGVSRLHLVFARVFDEHGEEEGIGGFIAVRDETPGLKIGKREPAMGLRGIPETEIIFDNMEVTADALLLPPNVMLGPWIHVGSKFRHHAAARVGQELTMRAKITSNTVSKGHAIIEFDAVVVAGDATTVAEITHVAIWRPRQVAQAA